MNGAQVVTVRLSIGARQVVRYEWRQTYTNYIETGEIFTLM